MLPITGDLELAFDENDALVTGDVTDDSVVLVESG